MTREERKKELNRMLAECQIGPEGTRGRFTGWQGRVAALLSYSPTLQSEFKAAVKTVPLNNAWAWRDGGPRACVDIENILTQAINELGLPEEQSTTPVPILTDENGIWWFLLHCSWSARFAILGVVGPLLFAAFILGLKLGMMEETKRLYINFTAPQINQEQSSPTPAQPNK